MNIKATRLAALAFTVGLMSAPVSAAPVLYTDQASFNTAVGASLEIENFDDEAGAGSPLAVFNTELTQVSSDANQIFAYEAFNGGVGIGIQDSSAWEATFSFQSDIDAFGLLVHDLFENVPGQITFQTSAGENGVLFDPITTLADGNNQYLGLTTNLAFSSITLNVSGVPGDGGLLDDVGYRVADIPLPGTLALLALGAITLRRRLM
ncbi:MAG: hypothetical protein ACPG4N_04875 [Gammaproteobacteria bacterium]